MSGAVVSAGGGMIRLLVTVEVAGIMSEVGAGTGGADCGRGAAPPPNPGIIVSGNTSDCVDIGNSGEGDTGFVFSITTF